MLSTEDAFVSGRGVYHGVNIDPKIIEANRVQFAEAPAQWHATKMEVFLRTPAADTVGVLVFDSYTSVAGRRAQPLLKKLLSYTQRQADKLGGFVLSCTFSVRSNTWSGSKEAEARMRTFIEAELGVTNLTFRHYQSRKGSHPMLTFWVVLGPMRPEPQGLKALFQRVMTLPSTSETS
jgi:hypothetical protein